MARPGAHRRRGYPRTDLLSHIRHALHSQSQPARPPGLLDERTQPSRPRAVRGVRRDLGLHRGPVFLDPQLEDTLDVAAHVLSIVCGGLILLRGIAIVGDYLLDRAAGTETRLDDQLVPLVRQTANVFVVIVGALFVLSNLDVDVAALIAGLGIGGLAVALAAQDTIRNLLGGISVLADRPFQIGDWVLVGEVEGTVEKIGFRSLRIRTFKSSLVTVPNARLTDTVIDNMGLRRFHRYDTYLHLPLSTPPDTVQAFCEGIRILIRSNDVIAKEEYYCEFTGFDDSTIQILLYCFFDAPDWSTELQAKHVLNLDILRLARRLGVQLAAPGRRLELERWLDERTPQPEPGRDDLNKVVASFAAAGAAGQAAFRPIIRTTTAESKVETPRPADAAGA